MHLCQLRNARLRRSWSTRRSTTQLGTSRISGSTFQRQKAAPSLNQPPGNAPTLIAMLTATHSRPRSRIAAHLGFQLASPAHPSRTAILHYFATRAFRLHPARSVQNPYSAPSTFDFSIPEARLLLTRLARFSKAQEFDESSHLRLTSPRILSNWDLTNGVNGVMIDCMHDAKHLFAKASSIAHSRLKTGQAREFARLRHAELAVPGRCRGENLASRLGQTSRTT
jgi:hypothetical protein